MPHLVETFRSLHKQATPLRLPNAWDAGSARLFESLGASAVATTSAGVAWALGYADGRVMPVSEAIQAAARMVRVIKVPLTYDIEHGYSDSPDEVASNVMRLVELGVAGINIEDGPDAPKILAAKIEAIKNAVSKAGGDLFVNARCDVFLAKLVEDSKLVEESIARAKQYAASGADGLFLPAIHKPEDIEAVVSATSLPLNAMAWPGLADAATLSKLGVRRLSAGSGIPQTLWARAQGMAQAFLHEGRSESMSEGSKPYGELQALFKEI